MKKPKYGIISEAPPALSSGWIGSVVEIKAGTTWGGRPAYLVELKGQPLYVLIGGIKEITEEQANNPLFIALAKETFRDGQS
ncbi:MAG TPA: hypothetical protein VGD26_04035 [Chitinophagaceae bacterium]